MFTLVKIFYEVINFRVISCQSRSFSNAYKFWTNPSKSGFLTPKDRSNPPLLKSNETSGPNLPKN